MYFCNSPAEAPVVNFPSTRNTVRRYRCAVYFHRGGAGSVRERGALGDLV